MSTWVEDQQLHFLCVWPWILKGIFDIIFNHTFGQVTYNYNYYNIRLWQCLHLKFREYGLPFGQQFSENIPIIPVDFWRVAVPFTRCPYKEVSFQSQIIQWCISTNGLWNPNLGVADVHCAQRTLCAQWIVICSGLTPSWQSSLCLIRKCSTLCEAVHHGCYKS